MKKSLIIGLILVNVVFTACNKTDSSEKNACIEVKLITELCGSAVLQVVKPYSIKLELQDWTDLEGIMHQNVFSTILPCNIDHSANTIGAIFYVEIMDEVEIGECMRCMAILTNMPKIGHNIRFVESCN